MPTEPTGAQRPLPHRPNLRHLRDQAKDLLRAGGAGSLADVQFQIARLYGFRSWVKLKAHVESFEEVGRLKQAIDGNDLARVQAMMTRNPALHRAPLGYGEDGPLTWSALNADRIAMMELLVAHGADVNGVWLNTATWRPRRCCWRVEPTSTPGLAWMKRASAGKRRPSMR
jgi:hypothetical protein